MKISDQMVDFGEYLGEKEWQSARNKIIRQTILDDELSKGSKPNKLKEIDLQVKS